MANDPETKIEFAEQAHSEHLSKFVSQMQAEKPSEQASKWIALLDEAIALPHRSFHGAMSGAPPEPVGTLSNVLITLPGPASWPYIKALAFKRPPSADRTALLILVARLTGDDLGVIRLCEEYDRQAAALQSPDSRKGRYSESDTITPRLDAYWRLGRMNERNAARLALEATGDMDISGLSPKVTDELLLGYLKNPENQLSNRGTAVKELGRKVALKYINQIPSAHWELAEDVKDLPYLGKLIEHYGYKKMMEQSGQGASAKQIYFYGIVTHKDLKKSIQFLSDTEDIPRLEQLEWPSDSGVIPFIETLGTRFPKKDFSNLLMSAISGIFKPHEAASRVLKLLENPKYKRDTKLQFLSKLIELDAMSGNLQALSRDYDAVDRLRNGPNDYDPAYQLIDTAVASGDQALIDKGVARFLREPARFPSDGLIQALIEAHRFKDLERMAISLCKEVNPGDGPFEFGAKLLCDTYYRAGRPQGVLTILEKFPNWAQPTLAVEDRRDQQLGVTSTEQPMQPLGFYAAWAYSKTGRKDLAVQILRDILLHTDENASCFNLLNSIGGQSCLAAYKDVRASNPYSAGAVLWESDLMFRRGDIKLAAAGVRRALAIDPIGSFLYREKLAELRVQILEKQGDQAGARRTVQLLKAIRLGHRGDHLLRVNLLPQAEEEFTRALAICPADAALRLSLGICLERQNRKSDARRNFLKALETISDAVGETTGPPSLVAETLARSDLATPGLQILSRVVSSHRKNSASYQARGMLNRAGGRFREAASDFRKAFAFDPARIDAVDCLMAVGREARLTSKEMGVLALKKINLSIESDVQYWSDSIGIPNIGDLSRVYQAIRSRLQRIPIAGTGALLNLHSGNRNTWLSISPEFDRFTLRGRLIGRFFQMSRDVGSIGRLYHPTGYPFE